MAALSKLRELSLPYNCYEVGHTWTPECYEAALSVGFCCLIEGMKIYAPLYLGHSMSNQPEFFRNVTTYCQFYKIGQKDLTEGRIRPSTILSQILQRKFSLKEFWNTLQGIYTSSCFLGFNAFAFIFIFCLLRKSMGKFYYLHCSYLPAFAASFLAILIERKSRRGPLALYVTNVASETLFRMAAARGLIKPVPNGETYLFSATMAFFLYIVRKHGFSRDFVSMGFKYVFGKEEAKPYEKAVTAGTSGSIKRLPSTDAFSALTSIGSMTECVSTSKESDWMQKLWDETKQKSCPHSLSCMQYSIQGFLRPFVIGYLAYSGIRCLAMGKKIYRNPSLLPSLLTEKRTLNLGLFLGGFGGTFRTVNCLLRWLFKKDQACYALPAGFLAGLFMKFFPSPTLALYLAWKLIEVAYALGIQQGKLPKVRGSMLLLYATSTAVLFYAAVLEPHNLKPAYLKFLTRLTQNKIGEINRHVLDIFGTHASRLYSHFWPELDLRYTSRVFQESVLLWLIH